MHEFSFKPLFALYFLENEASCAGGLAEDAETIFVRWESESDKKIKGLAEWG